MKKRIVVFAMVLCLIFAAAVPALASETELPRLIDDAQLLTPEQNTSLADLLERQREVLDIDIVIVTTWSLDGKDAMSYADDYYDSHGYGLGSEGTGILLLVCMGTREWYMSTCGDARYIFTDYGLDQLGDDLVTYLSSGDYYGGFAGWVNNLSYYVERYLQGEPVDGYVPPDDYESPYGEEIIHYSDASNAQHFLIALVVGLVSALITVLIMRSSMNTAKLRSGAGDYLKGGSFQLNRRTDMFLYSRVSKTAKPKNNSGGGSSVHSSSGGRSHGGRGGRF